MSNANVSVQISAILTGLSDTSIQKGKIAYAQQFVRSANRFVPFKTGDLRNSTTIQSGGGVSVVYARPYATAQFYGVSSKGRAFKRYTTAGTGKRWDEKAVDADWRKMNDAFVIGANWG